jgi:Fic family protein
MVRALTRPPNYLDLIPQQWAGIVEAFECMGPKDSYLHWHELQKEREVAGMSHEAWWAALKLVRRTTLHPLDLKDVHGQAFSFGSTGRLEEILHRLDGERAGTLIEPPLADRFAASAVLREAISSAQLAGAAASFEVAREMLRTGRPPRDADERIIWNQYLAMQELRGWRNGLLTPERVLELHQCLTTGTLAHPDAPGRLRRADERPSVPMVEAVPAYEPPPAAELPARLSSMCAFANGQEPAWFVHPVVRAIVLHFWLAYDRPFVDGNGRTARMLFYWAMLRQGYALFDFVSISSLLQQAPARYFLSFLETETDDNDLTYFILQQAEVLDAARQALCERVVRKTDDLRETGRRCQGFTQLNQRQQALVAHALRQPDSRYVISRHQHSHGVTHQTARDDLFDLVRRDLLTVTRERRIYIFRAAADLPGKIQTVTSRRRAPRAAATDEVLPTNLL